MIGLLKIKALLIGLLLASPPVAAWMISRPQPAPAVVQAAPATPPASLETQGSEALRIPVEVHAKGSSPEMIYVEMRPEPIPEPATLPLVLVPVAFFLMRRRR